MRILLFGRNGQVGWELNRSLLALGELVATGRGDIDLSDSANLRRLVNEVKPDVVVNAAAYTNVDQAESEQELAHRINAVAPGILAETCQNTGALLVHYSTDYVFDGTAAEPYSENDQPKPVNIYGQTKNDGELAVRNACDRHLIIRTSWVYASRGKNFVRTMMDLMNKKEVLHVVDDQVGTPTWARYIADASAEMIRAVIAGDELSAEEMYGTYHVSCAGSCTWYDLAMAIRTQLEQKGFSRSVEILKVTSEAYETAARRPGYTVLDNGKVHRQFEIHQAGWEQALGLCLAELEG